MWWPYFLLLGLIVLFRIGVEIYRICQLAKAGMFEIDKMSGGEFEIFLSTLFKKMGYEVQITGSPTGDYGADLVIEKNGERTAVQAKRWQSAVGVESVREAYGVMNMHKCTKALVVTSNYFTRQAIRLAQSDNVKLWNRTYLAKVILSHDRR